MYSVYVFNTYDTHTHTYHLDLQTYLKFVCNSIWNSNFVVAKTKTHFFGCPGEFHLQNAWKLECKKRTKMCKMHTNPKKGINAVDLKVLRMNLHIFGANVLKFKHCAEICWNLPEIARTPKLRYKWRSWYIYIYTHTILICIWTSGQTRHNSPSWNKASLPHAATA